MSKDTKPCKFYFVTGAGLSALSGSFVYRGPTGLYDSNYEDITSFLSVGTLAKEREKLEAYLESIKNSLSVLTPSLTHLELKKLSDKYESHFLTQNIDGLLQKAGIENVYEVHGTLFKNVERVVEGSTYTLPDVVLFGDLFKQEAYEAFNDSLILSEQRHMQGLEKVYVVYFGTSIPFEYIAEFLQSPCTLVNINIDGKFKEHFDLSFNTFDEFKAYLETSGISY